jgi:hypothetical protein
LNFVQLQIPILHKVWGSNTLSQKTGWSNDNLLEINYQRLFHHGSAFQASYVWSKPFRVGGNYFRDGTVDTAQNYASSGVATMTPLAGASAVSAPALPPARPAGIAPYADWHALNVFEEYKIDNGIGIDQLKINGILDMPFGPGQRFLGEGQVEVFKVKIPVMELAVCVRRGRCPVPGCRHGHRRSPGHLQPADSTRGA